MSYFEFQCTNPFVSLSFFLCLFLFSSGNFWSIRTIFFVVVLNESLKLYHLNESILAHYIHKLNFRVLVMLVSYFVYFFSSLFILEY